MIAFPFEARANPENGAVLGGSGTISTAGSITTIQQSSARALIRWDSFDVGAGEQVNFVQPSSSSITVNRITDTKASRIDGGLTANGNIILINPNGVVFGSSSVVDVGGLVATTSDLDDDNAFMAGGAVNFTRPGAADAQVINNGTITIRDAGLVGLVAPHVENNGTIRATLGKVHLAAGDIHTIDLAGDGLIKLAVSPATSSLSVKNTGTIEADGGQIVLTAANARHIVNSLVTNTGTLQANTIVDAGGTIRLGTIRISTHDAADDPAAQNNHLVNTGILRANGVDNSFLTGGSITLLSNDIVLGQGAVLEAYGMAGGGRILVGGDYQGGGGLPPANHVYIDNQAILNASSRKRGNGGTIIVWSEDNTNFFGHADASGGAEGGDGGFIEISGKRYLDFTGTVNLTSVDGVRGTLLLDPTNIVISNAADQNNGGGSPYSPTGDDVTSVLNVTTLQNALASGDVIVQTRATGSQPGNITVSNAVTWTSGNLLTLDAHNDIIISAAMNGANLTMIAGNDVQLNANVTGTGTITITPNADNITIGLGTSAVGVLNLSATEIAKIVNGWSEIVIGRTTSTAAIDMRALTWNDALTVQSGTGAINVNGIQTMGSNTLSFITDGDIALNLANALTGTGTLNISQSSVGTGIGLGDGQAGAVNLTTAEVGRIKNGWAALNFGRADGSADINLGALSWSDNLTLQTGSGIINVNAAQNMAANTLTIRTDSDLNLAGNLIGTGTLNIVQSTAGTSMGLGDGQAGTLALSTTELGLITNGWAALNFGRTDGVGAVNVGALAWNDVLTLQSGSGVIAINGTQTMAANNLTIRTDADVSINANLTGTGTFLLTQSSVGTTMGIGDGQAGTILMENAELALLTNGWASQVFGRIDGTGDMNVGARSWVDPLTLRTGTGQLNINGAQSMAANALTLSTDSDLSLNANLVGTGTLTITPSTATTSVGVGTGQTGTLLLDDTELAFLINGWTSIVIGSTTATGDMNVGARSWVDPLTLRTGNGQLNINGALNMAANNLALQTNSDLAINAALTGTGTLTILPSAAATNIGIGDGQAGSLLLSDAELARITNGWTTLVFGSTSVTGSMNIAAHTWDDSVSFRTSTGTMNINGTQNVGTNNLTLQTNSNLSLSTNLVGTGILTILGASTATTMGIGTAQSGTLSLDDTELGFINDGWASIVFGSTSMTGAMNIGAQTWLDTVDFRTAAGAMNVNGAQNVGANNLIFRTNSNMAINAALVGTGNLTILPSTASVSMAVGTGQTGTLALSNAELNFISDGWTTIILGSTSMTGAMNVGARTWNDNLNLRTSTGVMTINGTQTMGANNLTLQTNSNLAINAALTGTGILTILPTSTTTTMGIGTGQTGTLSLNDTELNFITNGWGSLVLGSTTATGVMNVGAQAWNDNLTLITSTGVITIAGAQTMGANNLTIQTSGNLALNNALSGTGTLTIKTNAASTTVGIGTGQTGTLSLTDVELGNIADGWGNVVFGRADGTGIMSVGALSWNDDISLVTGTGVLNIYGIQNMGANDLSLITNSNINIGADLIGTGVLTIKGASPTTTIGVGNGQAGTLAMADTELARFIDGWTQVNIGDVSASGGINIGAYTWDNPMYFITGGDIVINGVQNSTEVSGTSLVYTTLNGAFINNAGAGALNAGGGRYLVYSVDENNDTLGGLVRPTILTNKTYAGYDPSSVVEAGDVFLYSGIVAKILTLLIDDQEKVYGGNLPTFTYTYVGGLQNGDLLSDVVLSYTMTAVGNSPLDDVGVTRTITGTFNTALGYSVNVINGTMSVIKAILTVEGDSDTRQYGVANPALSLTYYGFRNGDDINDIDTLASADTAATILSDVGNYAITGSGALDDNYDFVYVDGTLAITKAVLTATAGGGTREYGDANPGFTVAYTGFRNGDTQAVIDTLATAASAATATSNVGSYATVASGAFDNNYSFTYVNGSMTVTKATLTAAADDAARDYGDANPALTVTYTGFKNGETQAVIDTLATASTAATVLSNVGTYAITAAGASDNNYNFVYNAGTLTVDKATLTATASSGTREYGDANPALTVAYTGFKNGETSAVIDTLATAASAANATSNVGSYATTASGGVDNNYDFTYVDGVLAITKAMLTATAGNGTREYGDANPAFTVTYTGFKNGETSAVIDTLATAASAATAASNVGTYATAASGGVDNNYDFTYVDGVLTVTKAMLTATADSVSREVNTANPAFTVTYTGFKNAEGAGVIDTPAVATSGAILASPVGTYAITAAGASDNNYNFTYVDGVLTVTLPPPVVVPVVGGGSVLDGLTSQQIAALTQTTSQHPVHYIQDQGGYELYKNAIDGSAENSSYTIIRDTRNFHIPVKKKRPFLIGISSLLKQKFDLKGLEI